MRSSSVTSTFSLLSKDKVWALISCQVSARVRVLLPSQMSCPVVENLMENYHNIQLRLIPLKKVSIY